MEEVTLRPASREWASSEQVGEREMSTYECEELREMSSTRQREGFYQCLCYSQAGYCVV